MLFEIEREEHLISSPTNLRAISEIRSVLFPEAASPVNKFNGTWTTPVSPLRAPIEARVELQNLKA